MKRDINIKHNLYVQNYQRPWDSLNHFSSYPCPSPDIWSQLKNWQIKHKVDSCDELSCTTDRINKSPQQIEDVTDPPIATKFDSCNQNIRLN